MIFYLWPLGIALLLALAITPVIRFLALKHGIVDLPGPRKIHPSPTPLLGGLAVFLAFFISVAIFWLLGMVSDAKISEVQILAVFGGGLILMIGGYLDDRYNLQPWQQFIFPVLASVTVILAGLKIEFVSSPLGGILHFPAALGIAIAFFWLLGMIYTTKFLDGLDGLASGITAIGAIIIFFVSLYWDVPSSGTSVLALVLAGSALGFLVFNWHPAKIFLGEGGSVFCGFMLGTLSIISGSKIATALLIMGVPILDVFWVIIRRLWQGRSPVAADRKHLHFRLLDIGLSQRQAVVFLYLITAAFGVTSLFLPSSGKLIALMGLAVFMVILGISLILAYQLKSKHE